MIENKQTVDSGFDELGIKNTILASIKKLGFTTPTPIQEKTIPIGISGQDLVGVAQTGTGKTLAFGIPMIQRLGVLGGRGLVLLPTRELALQVEDSLKKLGNCLGLRTAAFIGGEAQERQLYALRRNPDVIVATPGRLIDFLKRRILNLDDIKVLVLDEADMMFDLGFAPQVEEILTKMPSDRQTMLFSATMPNAIAKLAATHMKMPVSIETAPSGTTAEKVDQEMYIMRKEDKIKHLEEILNEYKGSVLIFVRTKYSVTGLTEQIKKFGHTAEEIHSNLSLRQRRRALDDFKSGKSRILVATDIAARGLDVNGIELVINYNLPDKLSDYVHRIGRTGRAGKSGKAISFATPDQTKDIRGIEQIINQPINLTKFAEPQSFSGSRSRRPVSRGKSYGAKPARFTADKPYKKFDQASSTGKKRFSDVPKKYSKYEGKDNFERDQRLNHLPKFNNKPDFDTFKFVEDTPTSHTRERREGAKPRTFSKPAYAEKKTSAYEGRQPRTFSKPAYGERKISAYEGSRPRTAGKPAYGEKRTFAREDSKDSGLKADFFGGRTSSYHSGRPTAAKKYSETASYKPSKSRTESAYGGAKPKFKKTASDTWTSHSQSSRPVKSGYGARKTASYSTKTFGSRSKSSFKKAK